MSENYEYKKIERTTGNPTYSISKRREITIENWKKVGEKLFGPEFKKWKFVCVKCGNIQSIESMLEHNPNLEEKDLRNSVYFNCEGRLTDKIGCDWSLGGLFKIHQTEVKLPDGDFVPVFDFSMKGE